METMLGYAIRLNIISISHLDALQLSLARNEFIFHYDSNVTSFSFGPFHSKLPFMSGLSSGHLQES